MSVAPFRHEPLQKCCCFKLTNQLWCVAVTQSDILEIHNLVVNNYQYDIIDFNIIIGDVCKHILMVITVCPVHAVCRHIIILLYVHAVCRHIGTLILLYYCMSCTCSMS